MTFTEDERMKLIRNGPLARQPFAIGPGGEPALQINVQAQVPLKNMLAQVDDDALRKLLDICVAELKKRGSKP